MKVTKTVCDIYGTTQGVRPHSINITTEADDGGVGIVCCKEVDLSPRAIKRLLKFLDRATTKP